MEADVAGHEALDEDGERDLDARSISEAAAEGQEEGDVAGVDGGVGHAHDLRGAGRAVSTRVARRGCGGALTERNSQRA